MKVSVIVPVFNTSKYLARCLDSILSQTQKDFELIAINDGSSDNSAEILSQYASRDSRIIIVTQRNKGLSAARNSGLKIARGEWIMFVDSDDFIPCDAIEKFLLAADESKESVVISKEYLLDDAPAARSEKVQWKRCAPALKELIKLRKAQSSAWNKFYSAALLKNRNLASSLVINGTLSPAEGVDIFHLAPCPEPDTALRPYRYIYIASNRALLHFAIRNTDITQNGTNGL